MSEISPQNSLIDFLNLMGYNDPKLHRMAEYIQRLNEQALPQNTQIQERQPDINIAQLKKEYRVLLQRNDYFASALGACPKCFGYEPRCECQGEGKVGSQAPNREAFMEIVYPVLDRFGSKLLKNLNQTGEGEPNQKQDYL